MKKTSGFPSRAAPAVAAILFLATIASAATQELRIFCEDDKPMQYLDEAGNLTGMSVEVVREIQRRVGNGDPIVVVPWIRGLYAVTHEPNVVLFSMARTKDRDPLYRWIGPVAESIFGLYVRADSDIRIASLEEAKKLHGIGVYRGDVRDDFLTKAGFSNLERTGDNVSNFKKLMTGRIDAHASSSNDIKGNAERAGYRLEDVRLELEFLKSQIYVAMSLGTPERIAADWNRALAAMRADGTFQRIFRKYYPDRPLPSAEFSGF